MRAGIACVIGIILLGTLFKNSRTHRHNVDPDTQLTCGGPAWFRASARQLLKENAGDQRDKSDTCYSREADAYSEAGAVCRALRGCLTRAASWSPQTETFARMRMLRVPQPDSVLCSCAMYQHSVPCVSICGLPHLCVLCTRAVGVKVREH